MARSRGHIVRRAARAFLDTPHLLEGDTLLNVLAGYRSETHAGEPLHVDSTPRLPTPPSILKRPAQQPLTPQSCYDALMDDNFESAIAITTHYTFSEMCTALAALPSAPKHQGGIEGFVAQQVASALEKKAEATGEDIMTILQEYEATKTQYQGNAALHQRMGTKLISMLIFGLSSKKRYKVEEIVTHLQDFRNGFYSYERSVTMVKEFLRDAVEVKASIDLRNATSMHGQTAEATNELRQGDRVANQHAALGKGVGERSTPQ